LSNSDKAIDILGQIFSPQHRRGLRTEYRGDRRGGRSERREMRREGKDARPLRALLKGIRGMVSSRK